MSKQLTERQILRTWDREYLLSIRAGFSIPEAVQRADDALAAKRAQLREAAAQQNSDTSVPVKLSPHGYKLYWCAGANCYASVPED